MTGITGAAGATGDRDLAGLVDSLRDARPAVLWIAQSDVTVLLWQQAGPDGIVRAHYAVSLDGRSVDRVAPARHEIQLRYAQFDPLAAAPVVPEALDANGHDDGADQLLIVQFETQPLEVYRRDLRALGATIQKFLPDQSYIVRLPRTRLEDVAALPYVRWTGPFHPAYKLETSLHVAFAADGEAWLPEQRYRIQVFGRGPGPKRVVARRIAGLGGRVDHLVPEGFLLEATLTAAQLAAVARMPEVAFIERWTPRGTDMSVVRTVGGANAVEVLSGFTGEGVRGEVMDTNLDTAHPDFQATPPLIHGGTGGSASHGTSSYGVVFGDGSGNFGGRGMIPGAQGIFADYGNLSNRYTHTAQLLQSPYFAVFQTNSWGNTQTPNYTSISAQMDDVLFINDLLVTQSQSNTGNQSSRPQAWAKNIVAVGGIRHWNTADLADDCWCGDASIGPAADGRIKPDLALFNDSILTTAEGGGYTNFGGTSAATPETAGHFGLFFQMWSEGIFGNTVDPVGTVFENRPHMSTAKAMLINAARPYSFNGPGDDLARTHQGWGLPDVARLLDLKGRFLVLVDETDVLSNLQSTTYEVPVEIGGGTIRATLVYTEPSGTTSSSQHRINDLSLKVTAPDGTVYWGNHGLLDGIWSVSGGSPNTIDNVENVFIEMPASGNWTVEVQAAEINEDSHVETPQVDADYALVVSVEAAANETCGSGPLVTEGTYVVSNIGATTDGPDESGAGCGTFESDVWYKLIVPCTGLVTVDLCDAGVDAQLAVYDACPTGPGEALACADDVCGQAPQISFAAVPGLYRLRLGGVQGSTTMIITCDPAPACPADCANSDGVVDIVDLLDLLGQWGDGSQSCDLAPEGGDSTVDIQDLLALLAAWGDCP
jgi:hypothetical protein